MYVYVYNYIHAYRLYIYIYIYMHTCMHAYIQKNVAFIYFASMIIKWIIMKYK